MKKVFVRISLCSALLFLSCEKKAESMEEAMAYSEEAVVEANPTEFSKNSELDSKALFKTPKDKKFKKKCKIEFTSQKCLSNLSFC